MPHIIQDRSTIPWNPTQPTNLFSRFRATFVEARIGIEPITARLESAMLPITLTGHYSNSLYQKDNQ